MKQFLSDTLVWCPPICPRPASILCPFVPHRPALSRAIECGPDEVSRKSLHFVPAHRGYFVADVKRGMQDIPLL
jgi:hypothetical protein